MSAEAIRKKIEGEVGGHWSRSNLHGVDLKRCLLREPVLAAYKNSFHDPGKPEGDRNKPVIQLWLVLEEDPVAKEGYAIVYDEAADRFGLATGGTFIGFYGNFIDTFEGM
jgi:hypothetical protein